MNQSERNYPGTAMAVTDWDGSPAAIVSVRGGQPLVLLVSEEAMNNFNALAKRLGYTHTRLANRLRKFINAPSPGVSGEFCWQSVSLWLKKFVNMRASEVKVYFDLTW